MDHPLNRFSILIFLAELWFIFRSVVQEHNRIVIPIRDADTRNHTTYPNHRKEQQELLMSCQKL